MNKRLKSNLEDHFIDVLCDYYGPFTDDMMQSAMEDGEYMNHTLDMVMENIKGYLVKTYDLDIE